MTPTVLVLSIRTHSLLGVPVSKETSSYSMQFGIMDDINFIFACFEGCLPYNSGTHHHNNTGSQSQGGPVSTSLPRRERRHLHPSSYVDQSTAIATEIMSTNGAYHGNLAMTALASLPPSPPQSTSPPPGYCAFLHDFDSHSEPLVSTQRSVTRLSHSLYCPSYSHRTGIVLRHSSYQVSSCLHFP